MQTRSQQFPEFDPATADYKKLSVGFYTVTPAAAQHIIDGRSNPLNRNLRPKRCGLIQRDMEAGRFLITHQGLGFDRNGVLTDGHHRLTGVIGANENIVIQVTTGLDPEAFHVVDKGGKRTSADTAKALGYSNAPIFAAAARLLWIHENHGLGRLNNPECSPTDDQLCEAMNYHDGNLEASALLASRMGSLCMPSVVALCHYLFSRQNPAKAKAFFSELKEGIGLQKGMGSYALRDALLKNTRSSRKMAQRELIAYFFITWAAYRYGREIVRIRYDADGEFPSIEMPARKRRAA